MGIGFPTTRRCVCPPPLSVPERFVPILPGKGITANPSPSTQDYT
jgi:hypothetical protein